MGLSNGLAVLQGSVVLGSFEKFDCYDLQVSGSYGYCAGFDTPNKLVVVDVKDPSALRIVGRVRDTDNMRIEAPTVMGTILVGLGHTRGDADAFELATPERFVTLGNVPGLFSNVEVCGPYVYVAGKS